MILWSGSPAVGSSGSIPVGSWALFHAEDATKLDIEVTLQDPFGGSAAMFVVYDSAGQRATENSAWVRDANVWASGSFNGMSQRVGTAFPQGFDFEIQTTAAWKGTFDILVFSAGQAEGLSYRIDMGPGVPVVMTHAGADTFYDEGEHAPVELGVQADVMGSRLTYVDNAVYDLDIDGRFIGFIRGADLTFGSERVTWQSPLATTTCPCSNRDLFGSDDRGEGTHKLFWNATKLDTSTGDPLIFGADVVVG